MPLALVRAPASKGIQASCMVSKCGSKALHKRVEALLGCKGVKGMTLGVQAGLGLHFVQHLEGQDRLICRWTWN